MFTLKKVHSGVTGATPPLMLQLELEHRCPLSVPVWALNIAVMERVQAQ